MLTVTRTPPWPACLLRGAWHSGHTLAGGAEVVSFSFLGPFHSPILLPEKDPAVADQFLEGETMTVLAVTSELQPKLELFGK